MLHQPRSGAGADAPQQDQVSIIILIGDDFEGKVRSPAGINPEIGCIRAGPKTRAWAGGCNSFRVDDVARWIPRVARCSQPWAGGYNLWDWEIHVADITLPLPMTPPITLPVRPHCPTRGIRTGGRPLS
jgi:hypothetical protein